MNAPSAGESRPRRRWALGVLIAAAVTLVALVAAATTNGLVYYRTPSEVLALSRDDAVMRVGGYVLPGSVVRDDVMSTLILTDGERELVVHYRGPLPSVVQEGEGAVVEGTWGDGDVVIATEVLLRHSNEYRPPGISDAR